jgi:hypothetical protein
LGVHAITNHFANYTGAKVFTNSLEDTIGLIERGKLIKAQEILKRLIAANHQDLPAWFWFLETCSTNKQRINVLEICQEYNPNSEQVKQALDRLRSAPSQNLPVRPSTPSLSSNEEKAVIHSQYTSFATEISIPDNIKVSKNFQHLRIAVKWFRFKFIALTLFVIGFDALFSNLYSTAFPFEMVIAVTVNIGLIYYALAGYLNTTYIDVDFNSTIVRYEPLPLWGNKKISTKTISHLYYERDDFLDFPGGRRGAYNFYAVSAITNEKRVIKLVRGLDNAEEASFVKQEIEKFLNIDDFARLR